MKSKHYNTDGIGLWCLTPLSTILQLYLCGKFYWWRKPFLEKNPSSCRKSPTSLSHNVVYLALSRIRTHNSSQYNLAIKMRSKNYHTVGTILKSNRKIIERSQIGNPNTITHDHPLCWLNTGSSIKQNVAGLGQLYGPRSPLLVKWCGDACE
jgi:hypothetical protein